VVEHIDPLSVDSRREVHVANHIPRHLSLINPRDPLVNIGQEGNEQATRVAHDVCQIPQERVVDGMRTLISVPRVPGETTSEARRLLLEVAVRGLEPPITANLRKQYRMHNDSNDILRRIEFRVRAIRDRPGGRLHSPEVEGEGSEIANCGQGASPMNRARAS